jgi:hypothetical protein
MGEQGLARRSFGVACLIWSRLGTRSPRLPTIRGCYQPVYIPRHVTVSPQAALPRRARGPVAVPVPLGRQSGRPHEPRLLRE